MWPCVWGNSNDSGEGSSGLTYEALSWTWPGLRKSMRLLEPLFLSRQRQRYRDIRGRAPQQLLPGSEWRKVLMFSVAHQNDCVWTCMSLCVDLCLHVYVYVQVQPMRMGDSGPSHGPYSLPKSQNESILKTWTNAHSLKAGLSDCMPSPILPLVPQLGKNQP